MAKMGLLYPSCLSSSTSLHKAFIKSYPNEQPDMPDPQWSSILAASWNYLGK